MPRNNKGIGLILRLHLNFFDFPRGKRGVEVSLEDWHALHLVKLFLCQWVNWNGWGCFTCHILSVEDAVGGPAPHLGCPAWEDCHMVWLWEAWPLVWCVPVSAEAAPVCGLASLLPTPPLRSHTVCSGSQACLLLLVPGNQPLPPSGEARRHSMAGRHWEIHPCLKSENFKAVTWGSKLWTEYIVMCVLKVYSQLRESKSTSDHQSPPKSQLTLRALDMEEAASKIQFCCELGKKSNNSKKQKFPSGRKLSLFKTLWKASPGRKWDSESMS